MISFEFEKRKAFFSVNALNALVKGNTGCTYIARLSPILCSSITHFLSDVLSQSAFPTRWILTNLQNSFAIWKYFCPPCSQLPSFLFKAFMASSQSKCNSICQCFPLFLDITYFFFQQGSSQLQRVISLCTLWARRRLCMWSAIRDFARCQGEDAPSSAFGHHRDTELGKGSRTFSRKILEGNIVQI